MNQQNSFVLKLVSRATFRLLSNMKSFCASLPEYSGQYEEPWLSEYSEQCYMMDVGTFLVNLNTTHKWMTRLQDLNVQVYNANPGYMEIPSKPQHNAHLNTTYCRNKTNLPLMKSIIFPVTKRSSSSDSSSSSRLRRRMLLWNLEDICQPQQNTTL